MLLSSFYPFSVSINESGNPKLVKPEMKALQLYLKGRALNVLPDHSPEAETLLSRSVKLDPNLVLGL
jgi:hypothetical protein